MLTNEENSNQKLSEFYKLLEEPEMYKILTGK